MLHKTRGIVLRSVKYGETSLVVSIFTEALGLQSYLVNGVRKPSPKGTVQAAFFQPSAILDMVAYHNEFKNLQRLKEYRWGYIFKNILSDIHKNAVALFMVELLGKCLRQPEPNAELFSFAEDVLCHLDEAGDTVTANMPIFFALHLAVFFGFRISDDYSEIKNCIDLTEGSFTAETPGHHHYLCGREALAISQILKVMHPSELEQVSLNRDSRRTILQALEVYYALHLPEFGTLRTLPVLREIME